MTELCHRPTRRQLARRNSTTRAAVMVLLLVASCNQRRKGGGGSVHHTCDAFVVPQSTTRGGGGGRNGAGVTTMCSAAQKGGFGVNSRRALGSHIPMRVRRTSRNRTGGKIIRKWGSGLGGKGELGLVSLRMAADDDGEKDTTKKESESAKDAKESEETNVDESFMVKLTSLVPPKVMEVVQPWTEKLSTALPSLGIAAVSFVVGAVLSVFLILVPVYNEMEGLSEPVTLFETILTDLDRSYVDKVDTNKLFETGVSAMLRSLDPYTEFEGRTEAIEMAESVSGKYGGVGLVISGAIPNGGGSKASSSQPETVEVREVGNEGKGSKILPQDAVDDNLRLQDPEEDDDRIATSSPLSPDEDDDDDLDVDDVAKLERRRAAAKARERGIRVVSAFEGYAYDYGMRVGDKLIAIDGKKITDSMTVEDVRNQLRGVPGTEVSVTFVREGVDGVNTVSIPRTVVQIRDVKLATLLGPARDGIGYIQLTGFAAEAGREVRNAILALQRAAVDASDGEHSLQGLILDLRGNPGGLLNSAVDVASLLVPNGSDIVSAKGRGFPGVLYRSRVDPILNPSTRLAVLINEGTASAAEIVSGAVQDLDAGIIVGDGRTFGKGLVQNVEDLPFDTALKFTVAKYYTPSGRCIQSTNYKEGGGLNVEDGKYQAKRVAAKDRATFYTKNGREVKDGGGVEADFKVEAPKASALEVTLLRSGVISDYAAEWSKKHELTNKFDIDESTYRDFQAFVSRRQRDGDIKLQELYSGPLNQLKNSLKKSGYEVSMKELDNLQAGIVKEVQKDFEKYRSDIKEDLSQNILARYLPESMLIERGVKSDRQVKATVKLLSNERQFDKLLARDVDELSSAPQRTVGSSVTTAAASKDSGGIDFTVNVSW